MTELLLFHEDFTGPIRTYVKPDGVPIPEITTTGGWTPFWSESDGHIRPEMHVIDKSTPDFLEPVMRLNDAGRGIKIHKQWGIIDGGYFRQAVVPDGLPLIQASLKGHAWYSQVDDPAKSLYNCGDSLCTVTEGMRIWVGIDPTGGTDPFAFEVEWSWRNIYDEHDAVFLSIADPGPLVTVFIRTDNDYGFLHVDAYFASVDLMGYTDDPEPLPPSECRGAPRLQYARRYWLLPQDASLDDWLDVAERAYEERGTVGFSADDAGIGDLDLRVALAVNTPTAQWDDAELFEFFEEHYPGVVMEPLNVGWPVDPDPEPPEPEPEPPDPEWQPHNFVPTGIKLGWQAVGNCGLANMPNDKGGIDFGIYGTIMNAPTIKLVVAINDIEYMPCYYPMVRMIDKTTTGESCDFQSFSYDPEGPSPEAQAERRVADLTAALYHLRDKFRWTELSNEQDIPDHAGALWLARYSKRAMEVAPEWLGIGHFSFGTGNPPLEYWDAIAGTGLFELIAERGDALAFHSYHDHRVQGDLVWHLTRYRFLYNEHILPRQLDIPMVLTECGPWRHLFNDPSFNVAEWVIVTDQWLAQDPYAMGQIYCVQDVPGEEEYSTAFKALYPWFIDYARSVAGRVNA